MSVAIRVAALLAASTVLVGAANGQDYGPYGYSGGALGTSYGYDWNGFYTGVYGGGVPMGDQSWNAGIFTGVNVSMESAVFGVEAQLGGDLNDEWGLDALVLGKGGVNFGQALAYGTGGLGLVSSDWGYALGGGVEYGLTDFMTVRGEALGTGAWGEGPNDLRLTAGVAFHM